MKTQQEKQALLEKWLGTAANDEVVDFLLRELPDEWWERSWDRNWDSDAASQWSAALKKANLLLDKKAAVTVAEAAQVARLHPSTVRKAAREGRLLAVKSGRTWLVAWPLQNPPKPRRRAYYVHFDTYWQNSPDYFAGPFASRAEAERAIEQALDAPNSLAALATQQARDVRYGIRIYGVMPRTRARQAGLDDSWGRTRNVVSRVPLDIQELRQMLTM